MTLRRLLLSLCLVLSITAANAQEYGNQNIPAAIVSLANAGAGTTDSLDQQNKYGRGLVLFTNISAKSGTIAVTVKIQGKDVISGSYYDICTSASLTVVGLYTLTVYPGATPSANLICNAILPATWRAEVVSGAGVTPSVTATVGGSISY